MKKTIIAAALFIASSAFINGTTNWTIPAGTTTSFSIKGLMGILVNGTLNVSRSAISFDAASPSTSSVMAVVSVNSISTGIAKRDKHLKAVDYFDAATYPEIIFKSVTIEKVAGGKFIAKGNLTIKKVTQQVNIPFSFTTTASGAVFTGSFVFKRVDFGVGEKSMWMGNDVTVQLNIPVNK